MNQLGLGLFDLDVLTILIAYLFLFCRPTGIALFAFGQGFLIDVYSGGLHGFHTFSYLCIFFTILIGARSINIDEPKGQFFLVIIAVALKKILTLIIIGTFFDDISLAKSLIWISVTSAVATGIAAPILFYLFNRCANIPFLRDAT